MIESKIPLIKLIAIFMTKISINILAFDSSEPSNLEPKICSGKKLNTIPHMVATDANILNSVKNIPFRDASFSLFL